MKKIILILFLGVGILFSAESNCQISLYYANGVLQDKDERKAQTLWEIEVEKLQKQYPQLTSSTLLAKTSYNSSSSSLLWGLGGLEDFLEAFLQWSVGQAVTLARMLEFENEYALKLLNQIDTLGQIFNIEEINKHINAYNTDLKAGHGVVVVAHSQGNFFTNKAYEYLDQCNRERFKMVSVASPAASVAGNGPRISWDNDIVPWAALASWTVENPHRKRVRNAVGEVIDFHSIVYHGFNYYMGGSVKEKDMGKTITVSTNKARIQIVDQIVNAVNQINEIGCISQNLPNLTHSGAIEVTLSWTCANNVDLNLYLTGNSVEQDVKDVENLGLEHAYVASQSSIHPGDAFVASSTGKKREESQLEESYLEDNPINIYAVVKTPGGSKFKQYEAQNFGQLTLGEFAAIEVKEKKFETSYSSGGGGNYATPVYTPPYVRTYNECDDEDKKHTCGCVPCEYIIHGMDGAVEYGPIGGAEVEIIRADTYGSTNPVVVYRGKTTNDPDLFKSGLVKFSQSDYAKFEEDVYYVVDAKGGSDLDRDDDLVKDATPTANNGTIHAIIKGSDLKTVAFRVNALTEAIYQTTGDLLGSGYDSVKLDEKLAQASKKLFREKTFIFNNEININYHDALLWAPGVDKKKLFKPYDTFVEPIVVKTYADAPRVKESYRLIYEKLDTDAPQLTPLAVEIPHTIPNNSIIGKVSIESEGISGIDHIELHGEHNSSFSIDKEGLVKIVDNSILSIDALYKLDMVAVGADTKRGIAMELVVKVIEGVPLADPNATVPTLESVVVQDILENSVGGTVVGQANFIDSSLNIVAYTLSGEDNNSFVIDSTGEITVADGADIDYEKSDTYTVKVSAMNEAGNESFPVRISFKIINEIDTPLHDLVYLTHLSENVPLGTVVGKIVKLREGRSPITSFDILNPNVPFALDVNGTIRTTGYIDYETAEEYNLLAMAKTASGNGNKVEIQILINDVYPETGKPSLQVLSASIDENSHAGVEVGRLNISQGASSVGLVELRGTGHSNFSVDVNGTIRVASGATLDYEQKTSYVLQAIAHNAHGSSALVSVNIAINNLDDEAPTLLTLTKNIEENATVNTVVGTLRIASSGEGNITDYTLTGTGAENFSIDENGTIRVSSSANLDYETTPSYTLQATVLSDAGESEPTSVRIYILNVPENPPVLKQLTLSIEENASSGTVVGTVEEDIGGDSPVISYILDDNSTFSIDTNGTLRVAGALDYETQTQYTLQVRASNTAGTSDPASITVNIVNVPDNEPLIEAANFSVEENSPVGTVVGKIDINSTGSSAITSIILEGTASDPFGTEAFSVDVNGTVRVAKDWLDYEHKRRYVLSAIAKNSKFSSEPVKVVIDIINVIDSPPIIHSHNMYIDENSAAGTVIGTLNIESESPLHSVILASRHFTIDLNGTIRVAEGAVLDYEYNRDYLISIVATNDDGGSTRYIEIVLNDIPDPTINSFTGEVEENSPEGTVVGTVDIESPTPITNVYLTGTGSENFTIDVNGTIRVAEGAVLDYETHTSYNYIHIYATNELGTSRRDIRINIGDILDSPPKIGTLPYGTSIAENSQPGTEVGKVTISHETPILNVLLSGRDSEKFTIDFNGTIRVAEGAVLDYDVWSTRYPKFVIEASNKFGTSSRSVTIWLSNVPDPTLYQTSFSVAENSVVGTVVGTARIDSDTPLTETYLTGEGSENFTIDLNGTIRVAEGAVLDYESSYVFNNIIMHVGNKYGINSINVYIYVLNIPDTPPIVSSSCNDKFFVEDGQDSSRKVGPKTYCGGLSIYSDSTVDSVAVVGENASDFTIDTKGIISIASGVVVDINRTKRYTLTVIASNSLGESSPLEITIEVHDKAYMSFNPEDNNLTKDIDMRGLTKDAQDNIYVAGIRENHTLAVIKYSPDQTIEWIKDYNVTTSTSYWWDGVRNLKLYMDNNKVYIAGEIDASTEINDGTSAENQNIGKKDIFAISLDTNGTSNWVKQFGTEGSDDFVGMLIKDNRLNIAVNTADKYDVDNNTSTLSEGVIYILESNGSIHNVVQFNETQIDKIYAWNLSVDHQNFIVYSKINSLDNIIQLDAQYSVKSNQIINGEFGSHTFVFDDVVYTVSSTYSTMQIIKYSSSEEEWKKEEAINGYLSNVQFYHDGTSIKILFNKGDFVYFYEYDLQGNQVNLKVYGTGNTIMKPFLIDGRVYCLDNNKIILLPT